VSALSEMKSGENWRRRDVTVSDTSNAITVKLWNELADVVPLEAGDHAIFTNLHVDYYRHQTSVKSNDETEIRVCHVYTLSVINIR